MLLDISIIPQTSEELFYFVTKRIPYLYGFWRFANAYTAGLSEKGAKNRVEAIESYLDNYNRLSAKKYPVSCSCGYASALPSRDFTSEQIQELFAAADKKMYEEKSRHHAMR